MSRTFHFKMQNVLEYRQLLEDSAVQALARARQAEAGQKERLHGLQYRLQAEAKAIQARPSLNAADLWLWRNFRSRLLDEIYAAEKELQKLGRQVEQARIQALQAGKNRKLLEKLKEKQCLAHFQAEQHKEQESFDEMATIRFSHQSL
jgi:flagellar FliJ protein